MSHETEKVERTSPPAIITIGVIAVAVALHGAFSDNNVLAVIAGAVAVVCLVLWAAGNYIRNGR